MKKFSLVISICFQLFCLSQYSQFAFGEEEAVPSIRLDDEGLSELVSGFGTIRVKIFPHDRDYKPHGKESVKDRLTIKSQGTCIVSEGTPDLPGRTNTVLAKTSSLYLNTSRLQVPLWVECSEPVKLIREKNLKSYSYSGYFYIRKIGTGKAAELRVINLVSLENYLAGVVPAEVSPSWHMETLKTQAVAARSYAVFHMSYARRTTKHPDYDVDDTVVFQAYTGVEQLHARTNAAIADTAGEILMYRNNIIQAYYHADSGGHTAPAVETFKINAPYCQGKKEPYAFSQVASKWKRVFTLSEMSQKFQSSGVISSGHGISNIVIDRGNRTKSGRASVVNLKLSSGKQVFVDASSFRRALGLKSLMFDVKKLSGKDFEISGKGFGHGVGMNQRGAKYLATDHNWNYRKILKFYYSNTNLCSINQEVSTNQTPSCSHHVQRWAGL